MSQHFDINFGLKPGKVERARLVINTTTWHCVITSVPANKPLTQFTGPVITSVKPATDKPGVTEPKKLFYIQLTYKTPANTDETIFLQTYNVDGYDHTQPDALEKSPAANLKRELVASLRSAQKGQVVAPKPPPPPSSSAAPPQSSQTTTKTTTKPPSRIIPEAPVSPATRALRESFLKTHPSAKEQYDRFVLVDAATPIGKTDHVMSRDEFWSHHKREFLQFRARTEQAPVATSVDVASNLAELNYSYKQKTTAKNQEDSKIKTKQALQKKMAESVDRRVQEISFEIQKSSVLDYLPTKQTTTTTTTANVKQQNADNTKQETDNSTTTTTTTATKPLDLQLSHLPEAQRLLGDGLGWGGIGERTSKIDDQTSIMGSSVQVKERMWLVNNVIKGLNLLGQKELSVDKESLLAEHQELVQDRQLLDTKKREMYKSDMQVQFEGVGGGTTVFQPADNGNNNNNNNNNNNSAGPNNNNNNTNTSINNLSLKLSTGQNGVGQPSPMASPKSAAPISAPIMETIEALPSIDQFIVSQYGTTVQTPLICLSKQPIPTAGTMDEENKKEDELAALFDELTEGQDVSHQSSKNYRYKRHHIKSTMMMVRANNTAHNDNVLKFATNIMAQYNNGVYQTKSSNGSNNNSTSGGAKQRTFSQTAMYDEDYDEYDDDGYIDLTQGRSEGDMFPYVQKHIKYDHCRAAPRPGAIPKRVKSRQGLSAALKMLDYDDSFLNDDMNMNNSNNNNGNDQQYVLLSEINPIDTTLLPSLPARDVTSAVLAATATSVVPHSIPMVFSAHTGIQSSSTGSGSGSGAGGGYATGDAGVSYNKSLAALAAGKNGANDGIDKEIETLLIVVKELTAHYWTTANRSIVPRPGVQLDENLLKRLLMIKGRLEVLHEKQVKELRSRFTQNNQPSRVSQLSMIDSIINQVKKHYDYTAERLGVKTRR